MRNEQLLRKMVSDVDGVLVPVSQALEMMSYFRSKSVLQRTSFRGLLEVNTMLQIPVKSSSCPKSLFQSDYSFFFFFKDLFVHQNYGTKVSSFNESICCVSTM